MLIIFLKYLKIKLCIFVFIDFADLLGNGSICWAFQIF